MSNASTQDKTNCNCNDENHKNNEGHEHIADECIHKDGTKHKVHRV